MNILVIRLSALGDIILSFATFAAIRAHHPDARITFLTTPPFKRLLNASPYFEEVIALPRSRGWDLRHWLRARKILRRGDYDLVYDLQRNDRTSYYRLLAPAKTRNGWLGDARADYARNPRALDTGNPRAFPTASLGWMAAQAGVDIPDMPYALLVPGSAPQHPKKRWPARHYATLAHQLLQEGVTPVVIGTAAERTATAIVGAVPGVIDLTGHTGFGDIAALAMHASIAIGNDTGPMHLVSLSGCPVVSLFSSQSLPVQSAPRGPVVKILQRNDLAQLEPQDVLAVARTIRR